jgi:membrane-bound metal-dependent hydrolase YbcI (DUF457 family)
MASFRGHLAFSSSLGAVYGGMLGWQLGMDWATSALAGGLTCVGGMMPDLDSDSGIPVREMFGLFSVIVPLLLLPRLLKHQLSPEQITVILGGMYLGIRYGLSYLFKRITVHRGMFHSIPALLISGMLTFLIYHHSEFRPRLLVSAGVMIGFLSHLVLDELYSVDFRGLTPKLNKYAGSALKFASPSYRATGFAYLMLAALGFLVFLDVAGKAPDGKNSNRPIAMQIPAQSKADR